MIRRKVLVIHESHTMRRIITRSLEGELGDLDIHEAESATDGIEKLHKQKYEVVVCGNEMAEAPGTEVHDDMIGTSANKTTPFVLLTSTPTTENLHTIQSRGIQNVLPIPFSGKDLARQIDRVCDPREWREHERYAVPGLTAMLHAPENDVLAEVANIGAGGMLSDIPYDEDFSQLFATRAATLRFPKRYSDASIRIPVQFLRMSVQSWKTPNDPETLRMAWRFDEISSKIQTVLESVLEKVMQEAQE